MSSEIYRKVLFEEWKRISQLHSTPGHKAIIDPLDEDVVLAAMARVEAVSTRALSARNDELVAALRDLHELVSEKFAECDVEGDECNPDADLCRKCESNGCIQLKIRTTRALLATPTDQEQAAEDEVLAGNGLGLR